jgi:hypothetical protein
VGHGPEHAGVSTGRASQTGAKCFAVAAMAWLLLFTVILREDWVAQTIATERGDAERMLGPALTAELAARGARWSDAALVGSGIVDASYALFTVPAAGLAQDSGFDAAVPWYRAWFERRLAVLFALAGQCFQRASFALPWLPAGLLLILPCTLDGVVRRQVRRSTFDYCSPLVYRGGIVTVEWIGMTLLLSLVAPWPQPAWLFPLLLLLFALAGAAIAANLPKEV